jgi:hypothetical protein
LIENCHFLTRLPDSLGLLLELKTLKVEFCCRLTRLPDSTELLTGLQELSLFGTTITNRCIPGFIDCEKAQSTLNVTMFNNHKHMRSYLLSLATMLLGMQRLYKKNPQLPNELYEMIMTVAR